MKKATFTALSLALTIALIWAISAYIGWENLLKPWLALPMSDIFIVLSLLFISYAIRATRIIHHFDLKGTRHFFNAARLMILHNFWNNLLPMRSGEASFPILMKSHFQIEVTHSIPALLWMRLLDLQVLVLLALVALGSLWFSYFTLSVLLILGIIAPFAFFALQQNFLAHHDQPPKILQKIAAGLPSDYPHVFWGVFWTWFNWLIKIAALMWVLSWFIDLNINQLLMGVIGGEFSSVLPIHGIAGMGTYEAGVMIGFGENYSQIEELLIAAVNLHLILFGSSLAAAIIVQIFFPKKA